MKYLLAGTFLAISITLTACSVNPSAKPTNAKTWQPSTLSPETMETANRTVSDYHTCITQKIGAFRKAELDSRAVTDEIMKQCDSQLNPIKDAFAAENVPPSIADRYIRRKRTQTTRKVLQTMMTYEAMRYTDKQGDEIK